MEPVDLEARQRLADTQREKRAYENALEKVTSALDGLRLDLHQLHSVPELSEAQLKLEQLISGCAALIKRIESVGR